MEIKICNTDKVEKITDDGNLSIGHVNNKAAMWDSIKDQPQSFWYAVKNATFGVNVQDEYIVVDGRWQKN
jgi:hypothetical protein